MVGVFVGHHRGERRCCVSPDPPHSRFGTWALLIIIGTTPDEIHENMFTWSVNMCAKVERLRDFVGLETNNMMRIVSTAADMIKQNKRLSGKKMNAAIVHK